MSFRKRCLTLILVATVFFCTCAAAGEEKFTKHSGSFFDVFDTIITYISYTQTDEEFERQFEFVQSEMTRYHRIFDQYHLYEGVNNLCKLNENATAAPTAVEPELIDLLDRVTMWRGLYTDVVNPALGKVLSLWHQARNDGVLPDDKLLAIAGQHCNFDDVLIDHDNSAISYSDPLLTIDLGAVAKGYAAQRVADNLVAQGITHFILNAGGNVICADAPSDGRACWTVAVQDIDGSSVRKKIYTVNRSVVTSGDYQRYVTIDGVRYHHLIDPETLYPADYSHAVTILCGDSGLADFLSTAAFLLPPEEAYELISSIDDCEAFWILKDNTELMTDGFEPFLTKP